MVSNERSAPPFIILVVEDNEEEAVLLKKAFEQVDIEISAHFVIHGEEAIDYLSGISEKFQDRFTYPEPDSGHHGFENAAQGGFELLEWFRNLREGGVDSVDCAHRLRP